jgi:hypothetical protein
MELIYIATSKQFPGMVKIGRTDRSVEERMRELSEDDYGTSGFFGDSEWGAIKVFEVEDNETAEAILHAHFDNIRVEDSRELFYSNNPEALADEAMQFVDGADFLNTFDSINSLFSGLSMISAVAGVTVLIRTFFPDNAEVWKVSRALDDWGVRLGKKTLNSDSLLATVFYGSLWGSFTVSKMAGEFIPRVIEEVVKEINENKEKETYINFLELQAEMVGLENIEYIIARSLEKYQNYEIHDLFSEQWRQFEILYAMQQADVKIKEMNIEVFRLAAEYNGLSSGQEYDDDLDEGAYFVDDE